MIASLSSPRRIVFYAGSTFSYYRYLDGDDGAFMPWFMLWGFVMCGVRLICPFGIGSRNRKIKRKEDSLKCRKYLSHSVMEMDEIHLKMSEFDFWDECRFDSSWYFQYRNDEQKKKKCYHDTNFQMV